MGTTLFSWLVTNTPPRIFNSALHTQPSSHTFWLMAKSVTSVHGSMTKHPQHSVQVHQAHALKHGTLKPSQPCLDTVQSESGLMGVMACFTHSQLLIRMCATTTIRVMAFFAPFWMMVRLRATATMVKTAIYSGLISTAGCSLIAAVLDSRHLVFVWAPAREQRIGKGACSRVPSYLRLSGWAPARKQRIGKGACSRVPSYLRAAWWCIHALCHVWQSSQRR